MSLPRAIALPYKTYAHSDPFRNLIKEVEKQRKQGKEIGMRMERALMDSELATEKVRRVAPYSNAAPKDSTELYNGDLRPGKESNRQRRSWNASSSQRAGSLPKIRV